MFSVAFCRFPFRSWLPGVKNTYLLRGLHALLPGPLSLVHMAALGLDLLVFIFINPQVPGRRLCIFFRACCFGDGKLHEK